MLTYIQTDIHDVDVEAPLRPFGLSLLDSWSQILAMPGPPTAPHARLLRRRGVRWPVPSVFVHNEVYVIGKSQIGAIA